MNTSLMAHAGLLLAASSLVQAESWHLDLQSPAAHLQWEYRSDKVAVGGGELRLEASGQDQCHAFYKLLNLADVSLSASFYVEPEGSGVHAVGFVLGSTDFMTSHYVHYDHAQAIMCRSEAGNTWIELARISSLQKPEGRWHTARLAVGEGRMTVFLNGKELYSQACPDLKPGRIGFYAGQSRCRIKDIVVSGTPVEPASEWTWNEPPRQWVRVCEDAGNGGYEAFPDACRLADGRIMAVFYDGYNHVSIPREGCPRGGRISAATSADEGRSWSRPLVIFDGPYDDRDPHITQLRDGRLLLTFFCHQTHTIPGWRGPLLIESSDGGKTWSSPRELAPGYYVSAPVRELRDGSLLLGLYSEKEGNAWGAVIRSVDGGKTWSTPADIDSNGLSLPAETDVIELLNGDVFAALRGVKEMAWSRSADGGTTWTPAVSFKCPGHCPYLLRASNNVLLLAHRLPATSLHWSTDEGETWNGPVLVDSVGGAYPSMVNCNDGSVLIVYYEEGPGSSIRAARLAVTPSEVKVIGIDTRP